MLRVPVLCSLLSLSLAVPVAGQRLGQPFPSRPSTPRLHSRAVSALRIRTLFPGPHLRARLGVGAFGRFRARPLPIGHLGRHLRRPARGGIVLIVPAQWYGIEAGYPVEAPLEATTYGIGDGYVPGDAMYEEPLGPGPATGAYIAVDGAGAASLPASEAGCALVTVLLVGSGSYAAAVVLPTMGATTPMELQEVLRDAHRRGRFVRLRGPGGLGMMIPAGPGIREIEVDTCR